MPSLARPASISASDGGRRISFHSRSRSALRSARSARSEEHTSELQSLMRISYAVFCLKKTTTILYTDSSQTHTNHIIPIGTTSHVYVSYVHYSTIRISV